MNIQKAIKSRIVELLDQKNISINKLAENSYLNFSTVYSIIDGHSENTGIRTITQICYGFGITIQEFFNSPIFDDIEYISI